MLRLPITTFLSRPRNALIFLGVGSPQVLSHFVWLLKPWDQLVFGVVVVGKRRLYLYLYFYSIYYSRDATRRGPTSFNEFKSYGETVYALTKLIISVILFRLVGITMLYLPILPILFSDSEKHDWNVGTCASSDRKYNITI